MVGFKYFKLAPVEFQRGKANLYVTTVLPQKGKSSSILHPLLSTVMFLISFNGYLPL
jgi:hypothetical protein